MTIIRRLFTADSGPHVDQQVLVEVNTAVDPPTVRVCSRWSRHESDTFGLPWTETRNEDEP